LLESRERAYRAQCVSRNQSVLVRESVHLLSELFRAIPSLQEVLLFVFFAFLRGKFDCGF
ncbi:MAG: hypothetical protein EBS05_24140, partial [Proteobacteria bacterium]|nr:hypothetical protein [Pseudomonadota bacterium]